MLSNASFLAKFRFDTAENEPAKDLQNLQFCNELRGTGRVQLGHKDALPVRVPPGLPELAAHEDEAAFHAPRG